MAWKSAQTVASDMGSSRKTGGITVQPIVRHARKRKDDPFRFRLLKLSNTPVKGRRIM